jgi:hypothetical protein
MKPWVDFHSVYWNDWSGKRTLLLDKLNQLRTLAPIHRPNCLSCGSNPSRVHSWRHYRHGRQVRWSAKSVAFHTKESKECLIPLATSFNFMRRKDPHLSLLYVLITILSTVKPCKRSLSSGNLLTPRSLRFQQKTVVEMVTMLNKAPTKHWRHSHVLSSLVVYVLHCIRIPSRVISSCLASHQSLLI